MGHRGLLSVQRLIDTKGFVNESEDEDELVLLTSHIIFRNLIHIVKLARCSSQLTTSHLTWIEVIILHNGLTKFRCSSTSAILISTNTI